MQMHLSILKYWRYKWCDTAAPHLDVSIVWLVRVPQAPHVLQVLAELGRAILKQEL